VREIITCAWDGTTGRVYCLRPDGTIKWTYDDTRPFPSFTLADINGDGKLEVILTRETNVTGDVTLVVLDSTGAELWRFLAPAAGTYPWLSEAAFDCDNDGAMEVIHASGYTGELYALTPDGTIERSVGYDNWVRVICVADINGDGIPEIIGGNNRQAAPVIGSVYCFRGTDFAILWEYKLTVEYRSVYGVCLKDVDGDGLLEVLVGCSGLGGDYVFCLNPDGTLLWDYVLPLPGFSYTVQSHDVDGDGIPEFFVGCEDDNLYCFNARTGAVKWTFLTGGDVQIVEMSLVDINGDGLQEIVFPSRDNIVRALSPDGTTVIWSYSFTDVVVRVVSSDADGDGESEVYVPCHDNNLYCFYG